MPKGDFNRWLYRGKRQGTLARMVNFPSLVAGRLGLVPDLLVTLEVAGRKTGKPVSFPLVLLPKNGQRYLVSMLGDDTQWVLNVRAAQGRAVLHHGRSERVRLEEGRVKERPPLLKAYLQRAPGARPHIPVDKDAPVADFVPIAAEYPVFRVVTEQT